MTAPVLRADETVALARRAAEGDRAAIDKLVRHNMGFITQRALRAGRIAWLNAPERKDDVVQEGVAGFLRSLRTFDAEKSHLTTYAGWWIDAFVRNYCVEILPAVRVGYQHSADFFLQAERMGDKSIALTRLPAISLDAQPVDQNGNQGESIQDKLISPAPDPEEQFDEAQSRHAITVRIANVLKRLRPREREIFRRRLLTEDPETLDAIGDDMFLSRERIRQIEKKALVKVLEALGSEKTPEEFGRRHASRRDRKGAVPMSRSG